MKACILRSPAPIETNPLEFVDVPKPEPTGRQVLVRVNACGVCRTDLHVIEGELTPRKSPITPGHQVVGADRSRGRSSANRYPLGTRVGIAWLHSTDGTCEYCRAAQGKPLRQSQLHRLHGGRRLRRVRARRRGFRLSDSGRISTICRPRRCCARASSASVRCGFPGSSAAAGWAYTDSARPLTSPSRWRATGAPKSTPARATSGIRSWRSNWAPCGRAEPWPNLQPNSTALSSSHPPARSSRRSEGSEERRHAGSGRHPHEHHPAARLRPALRRTRGSQRGQQYPAGRARFSADGGRNSDPYPNRSVSAKRSQPGIELAQERCDSRRGRPAGWVKSPNRRPLDAVIDSMNLQLGHPACNRSQ